MADFNPNIPTVNTNLTEFQRNRPIALIPDKSTGMALETAGTGIEGAAKLGDEAVKGVIKDDIYDRIDKERNDFTDALGTLKTMVSGKNPMDANAQASDGDLMPDEAPPAPQAIGSGLSKVQNLQAAQNSNKISPTMYYQRLNSIAKDMRSTYPGYRDYIDQEISKITGGNPANEYLRSMINDINRSQTSTNKTQDYYEKAIINSGFSQAPQVLQKFQSDHDTAFVQQWLAGNNTRQGQLQQDKSAFELADKTRADLSSRAEITANNAAVHAVSEFFYNRNLVQNDPTSRTSSQMSDFLTDLQLHPEKRDAEAIRNAGMQLEALRQRNYNETYQYLSTVKTKDGQSVVDVLGPAKIKSILDTQIGILYDAQRQMINDNNLGLVHSTQNIVGDIGNNKALAILKNPTVGGFAATGMAINKLMPNMSPDLYQKLIGQVPDPASDMLKAHNEQLKQILAQTGGINSSGQGGNVYTFKQMRDELDKMQTQTHEPDSVKAAAINRTIQVGTTALREKDPKIVDNAIAGFFDPTNRGSLNGLMDDYYDQARGVIGKGRTAAFGALTAPDISQIIWKRAHEGNGLAWDNYKGWANGEATSALTTMAQTWNKNEDDFAKQKFIHATEGDIPSRTDHHFYWDTDKHQIGVSDINGKPIDPETSWRLNPDLFMVRNANIYLSRLKGIAQTEGTNPDAYLFKVLKDAGWSPHSLDQQGKARVDARIMHAVITGQGGALNAP